MEDILVLIQNLPKASIRNISRSMLRHSTTGSTATRMHELFRLLIRYRKKEEQFYSKKMFGTSKNQNLRMLKHRVKRKIIEALTNENNILRNNQLDKIDKEFYLCTQYLFSAKMLLRTTGNSKSALSLISKVENKAKKYEFYSLLGDCLQLRKYQTSLIRSPKDFNLINSQIEKNQFIQKLTYKANDYYFKFIVNARQLTIELEEEKLQNKLLDSIYELKKDLQYSDSPISRYYILLLELEYYDKRKEFNTGMNVCKELKELIIRYPSVYKKQRLGTAEINLGFFQSKLFLFRESLKSTENAIRFTLPQSNNNLLYREQEVIQLIYLTDYKKTFAKIRKLVHETSFQPTSIRHSRGLFLKSILLFKLGQFKEALSVISKNSILEEDMSGWGIQQRLFQIVFSFANNKIDLADNLLSILNRKFKHLPKIITQNERVLNILSMLNLLAENGFSDKSNSESVSRILSETTRSGASKSWSPMEPEIIALDKEIQSILNIRIYNKLSALAPKN